ncbi:phosphoglycerate kinase [Asticcacaulis excentricus]|uniref:Phosphoglycerate kinase n=1 Tax=Asticcacaulis excentricus (strain ATCC 15261 / DSM 4724 / KCTC 12464 / NCIMB 9791 / VKM B-1370 / CB 48) TaxID=573065 RepID=E8RQU0_ASTEC|nr:phosphoglycerate kinase [Asticcacaulis excentricus]ADU13318.1 Phosphoglycerate kinase [Asticcacaulis excentricus CB 48]
MTFKTLDDISDLHGKTALVRVDFNVPVEDGRITDDTRLKVALPTIEKLQKLGAKVALLAHFDRPKGKVVPEMSLRFVAPALSALLGTTVAFADDCVGADAADVLKLLPAGGVALLENVRFHAGEEKNDPDFAAQLAALGDIYVNDAFSAAHRAHASTEGVAKLLPAYAGESMRRELDALNAALGTPVRPTIGIVGGSKVSTKLDLLKNLVGKLDALAIGGGMANTFLYAQGHEVGGSLCEKDLKDTALEILKEAEVKGCRILLPLDVVVAQEFKAHAPNRIVDLGAELSGDDKIFDAGPKTVAQLKDVIDNSKTLIWNGPLGVFELPPFDTATVEAAKFAAEQTQSGKLIAVAGGGDTVAALNHAGVVQDMTFVSTAGGAFLEWMEGKDLPGVSALG